MTLKDGIEILEELEKSLVQDNTGLDESSLVVRLDVEVYNKIKNKSTLFDFGYEEFPSENSARLCLKKERIKKD